MYTFDWPLVVVELPIAEDVVFALLLRKYHLVEVVDFGALSPIYAYRLAIFQIALVYILLQGLRQILVKLLHPYHKSNTGLAMTLAYMRILDQV